jgi:hypothetical protein
VLNIGLFLIINIINQLLIEKISQISIERLEYFGLTKKYCGTLRISDGTLECRGTQFENH